VPSVYLRDLAATLDRQLPRWASGRVIPRGLAFPVDLFLKGTARFMKKVGQAYPVLLPNNTATLAQGVAMMGYVLTLQPNSLNYLAKDYLLDLGGGQIVAIAKVLEDGRLWLDYRLRKAVAADSTIYVYGAPGYHNGERDAGADNVEIKLPTGMSVMVGDTLLQESTVALSYFEYRVTEVITNATPPHTVTAVRITPNLQLPVVDGGLLYLKANPAYFSQLLNLPPGYPDLPVQFGPSLLDRVTGLISDNPAQAMVGGLNQEVPETLELELYQTGPVLHRTLRVTNAATRTPVQLWNAPILPQHMVLWKLEHGVMDLTPGALVATPDARGRWRLHTELVPPLGTVNDELPRWRLSAYSDRPFRVAASVWPGLTAVADATASGSQYRAALWLDTGPLAGTADPPRLLELQVFGNPGQPVYLGPLMPSLPNVRAVRYRLLVETRGEYHWASSGLFLKPLFLSSEYVHAQGREIPLNQGRMLT
jgi:hypothetical protein